MSDTIPLPPSPDDAWGRFARGRDTFGRRVWVRPRNLTERHPAIEQLAPDHALHVLERWIRTDFETVEVIHRHAHGPPAELEPERRRAAVVRRMRSDIGG